MRDVNVKCLQQADGEGGGGIAVLKDRTATRDHRRLCHSWSWFHNCYTLTVCTNVHLRFIL